MAISNDGVKSEYWKGRRTLVTGATGIVGSWLCEELVRLGAYVVAFVRDDDPASRFYSDGIDRYCAIVRGDLCEYAQVARAINEHETDVVFHLGAQTIVGAALRDPLETFESNIRGTYNLLEAARRLAGVVSSIVVASSDRRMANPTSSRTSRRCRCADAIPMTSRRVVPIS